MSLLKCFVGECKLKELDEEKEELRKYQQLDKQRKSLEYAIYSKEVQDAQQKLTEVICDKCYLLYNYLHDFLVCFIRHFGFGVWIILWVTHLMDLG